MNYLLLGRSGDICTLLPALLATYKATGRKPTLIVSKDYATLLEGVSYVEPMVWPGSFDRPGMALSWARSQKKFTAPTVDCTVYNPHGHTPRPVCLSFDREIWHRSKVPAAFDSVPLIFDRRDRVREQILLEKCGIDGTPFVLTALKGVSSPFADGPKLYKALETELAASQIKTIDISDLKAQKPYDLLALYERAQGLVAIDSFPLHLAKAVPALTTVALIVDGPTEWHRSAPRRHHALRLLYHEALKKSQQIAEQLLHSPPRPRISVVTNPPHAGASGDALRRRQMTEQSRKNEFTLFPDLWKEIVPEITRDGRVLGDSDVPFVRDLIDSAFAHSPRQEDIIVIHNDDIGFRPNITLDILSACRLQGACFAHRWDFYQANRVVASDADFQAAQWYPGSDLFAFTHLWWEHNGPLFPDMVLGREGWDMVMRNLIKRSHGAELHKAIWHERHPSRWEQPGLSLPGNEHNRKLAHAWLAKFGGDWNDWKNKPIYV